VREIPFWLVWCEDGGEPRVKQSSRAAADREAERLAKLNPGKSFCVLPCAARFTERRVTVEHFNLDTDDCIPF
jgi:hypothetical protein